MTEFHIAHEQVVNGRKKYIIPLMLENVQAGEIQDADLRMYVESHTYLECNDKVCHTNAKECNTKQLKKKITLFLPLAKQDCLCV